MIPTITGISSLATRRILAELVARYNAATDQPVSIEAVGGVDAAKRVRAGETFDLVILADNVIQKLATEGHVVAGSAVAFVRSPMAMAVRSGHPRLDIGSAKAVQAALMSARSVGYSTGPSGDHLLTVLKSWGLDPTAAPGRLVQAKPGNPVAALVASGEVDIGIQQLSELLDAPGIIVLGILPPPIQSVTTFSIGIGGRSSNIEEVRTLITYLNASETIETKRQFGMEPA